MEFQKQDDDDLKFLAGYVYEKVFLHYTTKQWGMKPSDVDGAVTARVPVFIGCDDRYFQDKLSGDSLWRLYCHGSRNYQQSEDKAAIEHIF